MHNKINEITKFLIPHIISAGEYSLEIQKRIQTQPEKSQFTDLISQALTDADLSIQNYIETILLSKFPDITFYGEEHQQSLNQKYFKGGELEIWLDPIDGTLCYKNGHKQFGIILSFVVNGLYQACIWYMPAFRHFTIGSKLHGVYEYTAEEALAGEKGRQFNIVSGQPVILGYHIEPALTQKLIEFKLIDVALNDQAKTLGANPLALAEYSGIITHNAGVIDFLVLGKIIEWSGGVCTDINGQDIQPINVHTTPSYTTGLVAANSKELHSRLISAVKLA